MTTEQAPRTIEQTLPGAPPADRGDGGARGHPAFEWVGDRARPLSIVALIAAVVLGVGAFQIRATETNPEQPAFHPGGEIYDIQDRADELFASAPPVVDARFFVEAPDPIDGDVLTRDGLAEFLANAEALRADPEAQRHLTSRFDERVGAPVDGVSSIAHAVDAQLPGGLASASDADVKLALHDVLAEDSPQAGLRTTLSQLTTSDVGLVDGRQITIWRSPAFLADVVYQRESFDIDHPDSADEELLEFEYARAGEEWLREAQDILRGDQRDMTVLGLAIDSILVDEEQGNAAAPFIFGSIVLIVLLVGALLRSYWASAVVASGLAVTFLLYAAATFAFGLKDSLLLTFIVPIAVVSFGVDFFIHGFSRCREEQAAGQGPQRAYPLGMTAAAMAILLAVSTSTAAFLSNASSSIEAIRQFGIAAASGMLIAYGMIGVLGPKLVLAVEDRVGPPPATRGPRLGAKLGFLLMSVAGGVMVTMTIVSTFIGAVLLLVVFLPLFVLLPYRMVGRRNRRAAEAGRALDASIRGSGHELRAAGTVVHFLARWRVLTVPVTVGLALVGLYGFTQVEEGFEVSDFISSDTGLIQSVNKLETHFGESTGVTAYLYAEGDLTDPSTLAALDGVVADVAAIDEARVADGEPGFLAREFDGTPVAAPNAVDVVRTVVASPAAVAEVEAAEGIAIGTGPDGLPDTADQVAAIYRHAAANGVSGSDGVTLMSVADVAQAVHVGDDFQATRVEIGLATVSDLDLMGAAADALDEAASGFETAAARLETVGASGDAVADEHRLRAFTSSMVTSLLVALGLCVVIAWGFMRSLRYALVSVAPILLVVGWVYGFMYAFDYQINPVTATIAAIAVGVGVDFAMHFTMRFREEFVGEPSRFPALRRAGEGTGGALILSALTSIGGFLVMSRAPMPIFADFGLLTAVMILFSLIVSLMILPSLLLLVTPSRHGEERQALLDALRTEDYEPHSRQTALETAHH
jgi:predicted RND superfamily exporter protein